LQNSRCDGTKRIESIIRHKEKQGLVADISWNTKTNSMDKQELIDEYLKITDVNKDIGIIYGLMDKLGIKYKRTKCKRCRNDYKNLIAEELGLIGSAADMSDFNANTNEIDWSYEYVYIYKRPIWWHSHKIGPDTPREVIEEFVQQIPQGYYKKVKVENAPEDINNDN
jgi:hypothetical protein